MSSVGGSKQSPEMDSYYWTSLAELHPHTFTCTSKPIVTPFCRVFNSSFQHDRGSQGSCACLDTISFSTKRSVLRYEISTHFTWENFKLEATQIEIFALNVQLRGKKMRYYQNWRDFLKLNNVKIIKFPVFVSLNLQTAMCLVVWLNVFVMDCTVRVFL